MIHGAERLRLLRRSGLAFFALMLFMAALPMGCGDDEEAPPPVAKVFFIHESDQLGMAEIWANTKFLVSITGGQQTSPVEIATGENSFEVRSPGATAPLVDVSTTFEAQTYLFILEGTLAELEMREVGAVPPASEAGKAAVEVVNLYENATAGKFDVYVGGVSAATAVEPSSVSSFVAVDSGDVKIELYNEGDVPGTDFAFQEMDVKLADKGAYMIILRNQEGNARPSVSLVQVK